MRLIDADACESYFWEHLDDNGMAAAMNAINDMPTIEPQRKKGKWIDNHTTCSECGWQMIDDVIESPNIVAFNFCPNCGAEMLTEDKE